MDMSESIKTLTAALAKAQGEFKAVPKLGHNPFLNNDYVQLDDIIDAIRAPLSQNGIAWVQPLTGDSDGLVLETLLLHESGEWMSCSAPIQAQATKGLSNLQSFGVALSYMRRYMLTTMLGINSGDDNDGEDDGKGKTKAKSNGNDDKPETAPHWIEDDKVRKRFWAWARGDLSLTDANVHEALNVEHVADFTGTMGQAKELIEAWVKAATEEVPA
jgi:hypothetical protein